jgi:hypothetical protein
MKQYLLLIAMLTSGTMCMSQLPVSKEPMHHNVFENSYLRVLDVHLAPGDTSLFHKHETPSVFIVLNPVKTGSEVIIEDGASTALLKDSAISFESFARSPRIHRVWNADTSEFHVMDVEILNKDHRDIGPTTKSADFRLLFDEQSLRGYRVTLKAGGKISLPASYPYLVVCLNDAASNAIINKKVFIKKGDYLFIKPGEKISFNNKGKQAYSFAVIEVK